MVLKELIFNSTLIWKEYGGLVERTDGLERSLTVLTLGGCDRPERTDF